MAMVEALSCERVESCLGTDEPHPRLGWRTDVAQAAFHLVVTGGTRTVWDTGWVASPDPYVVYAGVPLEPCTRYTYRVEVRHARGTVTSSPRAWFETGLMRPAWDTEWLRAPDPRSEAAHVFLSSFEPRLPVREARAYVAGLGYHELRVNGTRCGDRVLDPAWTDYRRKVCYVTYDLTGLLGAGRNVVAVLVGKGRYREPVLNAIVRLVLNDGTIETEGTSHRTWLWSPRTPVSSTDVFHGERYDARIVVPGWDAGATDLGGMQRPLCAEPPGGELRAQDLEPIRVVQDLPPLTTTIPPGEPTATLYDLGQNISGWARIRVRAHRGTEIRLLYSEALRDDGRVEMRMNREARATDVYVAAGSGETEVWEPRFTYHGFRYVQVESSAPLLAFELEGRVVRTAARKIGAFLCADGLVNQIRTACEWTEADNLHSLPTDCPQREERMGWLNDMTVRAESALYTFDLNLLYAKWSEDIAQAQGEKTGAITDVAPFDPYHTRHYGNRPADPVSTSYLLTVWLCWLHYGDRRTLERRYPGLVRWYRYLLDHAEGGILRYSYWGDWASPAEYTVAGSIGAGAVSAVTPGDLVSTCYLYYDARLLERMAHVLGRPYDVETFAREAAHVREAFNARYWDADRRCYATGSQGSQAIPLALGLVPPEREADALARLARDVRDRGVHLTTGNLATRYVLEVLAEGGELDLAWALVTQRTYPSWGYMIDHGATTIWERWEHIRGGGMSSHNHPMYATVSGWLSKFVGGIRCDPDRPGFRRVVIRPYPPAALEWAEASLDTVRGTVRCRWERGPDGTLTYRVAVPAPGMVRLEVPAAAKVVDDGGLGSPAAEEPGRDARWIWNTGGGEHTVITGGAG